MSINLSYEAISDIGCVRGNNEDMAYVAGKYIRDGKTTGEITPCRRVVAFAVADGMGGYEGGEIASEIVCRAFGELIDNLEKCSEDDILSKIKIWAVKTNDLVNETAQLRPELSEMGTTFVGLIYQGQRMWLINIGDSRCYRYRQGILKQITIDHSERQRIGNPDVPSNLIYNFMGIDKESFISDVKDFEPIEGDTYILCSDGLSDLLNNEDIDSAYDNPNLLITKAKENGGRDNITIIKVTFKN